jgi:hypothetical protein
MKDSIPDMTAYAEELDGSTVIGHRRRFFAIGTGAQSDPGGSGSITIRKAYPPLAPTWLEPPVQMSAIPVRWPDGSSEFHRQRARRLAPYERTQLVRTAIPSLVRRAPAFDGRWLAIYLLSTVIIALISAITICSL